MNKDTEKVIKEYRFNLLLSNIVIVLCVVFWAFLFFMYLPDVQYKITKQALNEVYDERIDREGL